MKRKKKKRKKRANKYKSGGRGRIKEIRGTLDRYIMYFRYGGRVKRRRVSRTFCPPRLSDFRSTTATTSLINLSEQCIQMHVPFLDRTVHESVETNRAGSSTKPNRTAKEILLPLSSLLRHFLSFPPLSKWVWYAIPV